MTYTGWIITIFFIVELSVDFQNYYWKRTFMKLPTCSSHLGINKSEKLGWIGMFSTTLKPSEWRGSLTSSNSDKGPSPHLPSIYLSVSLLGSHFPIKSAWIHPLPTHNTPALISPSFVQPPSPVHTCLLCTTHCVLVTYLHICLSCLWARSSLLAGKLLTLIFILSF